MVPSLSQRDAPLYRRIVVPLDGSERSEDGMDYAALIAKELGSELLALRVIEQGIAGTAPTDPDEAIRYLEKIAGPLRTQALRVSTVAPFSYAPALRIVEVADEEPGTLICMSSQGAIGFKRWFLGSVAHEVLAQAQSPVMVVRRPDTARPAVIDAIVAPLDGTEAAEQVLPHVEALSKAFDAPVDLVHVDTGDGRKHAQEDMRAYLKEIAERIRGTAGVQVRACLLEGDPADEILAHANSLGAGHLIMMTTNTSPGVPDLLLGSMADRIVHRAEAPVLFVHLADKE